MLVVDAGASVLDVTSDWLVVAFAVDVDGLVLNVTSEWLVVAFAEKIMDKYGHFIHVIFHAIIKIKKEEIAHFIIKYILLMKS